MPQLSCFPASPARTEMGFRDTGEGGEIHPPPWYKFICTMERSSRINIWERLPLVPESDMASKPWCEMRAIR